MLIQLVPEMLGLVLTPAAIVVCVLLLQSTTPLRNVAVFAASFLATYVVLAFATLMNDLGRPAEPAHHDLKSWVSLAVGLLFVAIAAVLHLRPRRERTSGLLDRLAEPDVRELVVGGVAVSAINPNIAILLSGMSIVASEATSGAERLVGAAVLLVSSSLDFLLPVAVFLLLGSRGRAWLAELRTWLQSHDRPITLIVLYGFGVLFALRGLRGLA